MSITCTNTHVLLLQRALSAIVGIGDTHITADYALALERSIITLVADVHDYVWPHIRVADDALAVALFAEPPQGNARLLAAKD